jgi:hypothetical protein
MGLIKKLGIASALVPAAAFIVGWLFTAIVPGCHCEGADCYGCDADGLVVYLQFFGIVGTVAGAMTLLPLAFILAGPINFFARRRRQAP